MAANANLFPPLQVIVINPNCGPDFTPPWMESAPESDGDAAAKRPRMDGEMESSATKRRKRENGEEDLRRVAEIVLVLSAMGRMRGGRDPTSAEKVMMSEARKKVVALCEELAPKDILPREAFGVLIEDLGLNRLKEQRLGFRPQKLSISDKLAHTRRKMEEAKAFTTQPASYPSQCLQNTGAAGENRGTPPNARVLSSDKADRLPVSAGSFQPPTPVVHASSAVCTPLPFRPPGTEVRPLVVASPAPNNTVRDYSSVVPPRDDRAHIRPDGRPNGPSLTQHIPVSSSTDQHMVRSTIVPQQSQPATRANLATKHKLHGHLPARADGNAALSASQRAAPAAVGQTVKTAVSQTAHVHLSTVHHPVQGMQFVQPSPVNHHLEISKLVQKLLDPKLPERPAWTPPSRDYMNRAVTCQFCKKDIVEVENVLVCDACEKGYHLGCLQSYNAKGMPRGEWHCPRCLTMNRGKQFPPKYGRVTRNMNVPKALSNTAGDQLSSEKKVETVNEKVKTVNEKVNEPSPMSNGNSGFKSNPAESSSESNLQHGNEIKENDMSRVKNDDKPNLEKHPIDATEAGVESSLSTSTRTTTGKSPKQEVKSEVSLSEDRLISETEPITPSSIPQVCSTSDQFSTSRNQNVVDQERLSNGVEVPVHERDNCNGVVGCNEYYNNKVRVHDQARDAESSENGLHSVDWIGDTDKVVDEKKYFQSCCINGVVYKVHDYALLCPGNGKLIPVKLQAMWEESQTSSKWLIVHKCYFPDDLPEEVGRPGAPQSNEVYESTHDSNVMAGFIQGPCEVLPFRKFGEEMEMSNQGSQASDSLRPVFIRNWFYDESRRAFCPSAC